MIVDTTKNKQKNQHHTNTPNPFPPSLILCSSHPSLSLSPSLSPLPLPLLLSRHPSLPLTLTMGACGSQDAKQPTNTTPKGVLRKKTGIKVGGEGPPLVVLDFDLTLTSVHCGKRKMGVEECVQMGAAAIFDTPPGRLRSIETFLSDLSTDTAATVVVLTLNTRDVVQACLNIAGLAQYVDKIISCSSGKKGERVMQLVNELAPIRVVFADDDERNTQDVKQYVTNGCVLLVSGTQGLQPRHMEWLFYAAKGELNTYHEMRSQ